MDNNSFTATIAIARSQQIVYRSITEEVSKWWGGNDLSGNYSQLNDEFIVHHPGAHYSKQRVVEIIPGKKVVWLVTESYLTWLEKNKDEWKNTRMVFDISSRGDTTFVHFTHEGLVSEMESYDMCSQGWNTVIKERLYNFIVDKKDK